MSTGSASAGGADSAEGALLASSLLQPEPREQTLRVSAEMMLAASSAFTAEYEWEDGPVGSGRWRSFDPATQAALAAAVAARTPRLQLPELAGGALLDVGIYVVQARRAGATDQPRPPVILWACLPACIRLIEVEQQRHEARWALVRGGRRLWC